MTVDLRTTIAPKGTQLNADDLIGGPRTIRITKVSADPDSPEQPVSIHFDGDEGRPYKPCKSMRRVLVQVWGPDASTFAGRSMTLYRDPTVAFGGLQVGGIRISHMSHLERDMTMALTATRAQRKPYTVKPLKDAPKADPVAATSMTAEQAQALAMAAANKGTEAFRAWFNTDEGKACRAAAQLPMADLKAACEAADKMREDDPFGLPALPSEEEMARAEAEAMAAARAAAEAA